MAVLPVPDHFATAHDLLNCLQAGTRLSVVNPSSFWCGPAPNALPEARDVALTARADIYTSENDDDDDDESTYGRVPAFYTDAMWIYTDVS